MVEINRPEDSFDKNELDVEGHRVLRNLPGDESDDTEGHRVLRQTPADDDDDDTEGHRVLR
jgi:hypothetical protein